MKNVKQLFLAMLMISALILSTSCGDDDDDTTTPTENKNFSLVKDYLVSNGMDLDSILTAWVVTAESVYTIQTDTLPANDYYIIDLRSAADFAAGHIENAVNSTMADVLTTAANAGTKPILLTCYTGQNASWACSALRMSGFKKAKVMKWGMAGWSSTLTASWDGGIGNIGGTSTNFVAAPGNITNKVSFGEPTIVSSKTTGEDIVKERISTILSGGLKGVTATTVLGDPTQYCINNFWDSLDVVGNGNILGAYRIKPLTLKNNEYKYLNYSKKVLTYCWTGQTSGMITPWLIVLGYDAYSLKFGANSMINSTMTANKWSATQAKNYPLVN